jgi:hypothetical protein
VPIVSDSNVYDDNAQQLAVPNNRGASRPILCLRSSSIVVSLIFLAVLFTVNWLTPVQPFAVLKCDEKCSSGRFSSDSSMFVVAEGNQYAYDRPLRVLDVKRGAELVVRTPDGKRIRDIHFSSEAVLLAAHENDEDVVIWNLTTGEEKGRLRAGTHPRQWSHFRFTPDGRFLEFRHWGVGQPDSHLYSWTSSLWNVETQRVELGIDRNIESLIFSQDRRSLVSVAEPEKNVHEIALWQLASSHTPSLIRSHVLSANPDSVVGCLSANPVSVSPTLQRFATVDSDEVAIWNMATGIKERSIRADPERSFRHAWFSQDENRLDVNSASRGTWNVDLQTASWDISASPVKLARSSDKSDSHVSTDGSWRVVEVENGIRVVETDTGNTRDLVHDGDQGPPGHYLYLHDWQREWPTYDFSPDKKQVLVTKLVDPGHGPLLGNVLPSRFNPFRPPSSEPVGRLWSLESNKEIIAFRECTEGRFSPDGQVLATVHKGGIVKLWHVPFRKPLQRVLGLSVLIWLGVVLSAWLPCKVVRARASSG